MQPLRRIGTDNGYPRPVGTEVPVLTTTPGVDDRYRALLQVSKAINAHLELADVLEATTDALERLLPIDSIAVVTVEGDEVRRHALHVKGYKRRPGESFDQVAVRALGIHPDMFEEHLATKKVQQEQLRLMTETHEPFIVSDTERTAGSNEMDAKMRICGIRSYAQVALFVGGYPIGIVMFAWRTPQILAPDETDILRDVGEVLAPAVTNSLAYGQIRELRDQLHAENLLLREELDKESMFEEIVGTSPALRQVLHAIDRVAPSDSTVLLLGETGTGKELLARAIHKRSKRAARAMIKVNCAALPENLIGSELFGHEKGAFTGALQRRAGRFELASGGSLLLDEIGELPADVQAVLLRVLQEGEFERVGGTQTIRTNTRLIAATNRDLRKAVSEGRFRDDLFYRLNVFPIVCPPLRERRDDLPLLVEYFVARFARRMGRRITHIDRDSMDRLMAYAWPGNVRELQNVVERALILSDSETFRLDPSALADRGDMPTPLSAMTMDGFDGGGDDERQRIETALAESRGRVAGPRGAALRLGLPPSSLEWKIMRLNIDKHRFRSRR
jgi:formate hydrogenlyase transcriptional activator